MSAARPVPTCAPNFSRALSRALRVQDEKTGTHVFLVLDGHGEAGHDVSGFIKSEFARRLFEHPQWVDDPVAAVTIVTDDLEKLILRNPRVDTEFSGTTFVVGLVRGDQLIVGNIGDSRLTLGKMEGGKLVGRNVSIDHKPDLPAEKARIVAKVRARASTAALL